MKWAEIYMLIVLAKIGKSSSPCSIVNDCLLWQIAHMYVCMSVCLSVCMYVCMYVYIYMLMFQLDMVIFYSLVKLLEGEIEFSMF
jgi:hypothetical protein